jgi:hypothetical protein
MAINEGRPRACGEGFMADLHLTTGEQQAMHNALKHSGKIVAKGKQMKPFWAFFVKDPKTGLISGSLYPHDHRGFYDKNPYYIGYQKIEVCMEGLKK